MTPEPIHRWGAVRRWGRPPTAVLCRHGDLSPAIFRTRAQCRTWIEGEYTFLRDRPDLRAAPHFWRMPVAVRVVTQVEDPLEAAQERELAPAP